MTVSSQLPALSPGTLSVALKLPYPPILPPISALAIFSAHSELGFHNFDS